jgi:1,2-diacylglycerol 3-beta-galactosyltransferase
MPQERYNAEWVQENRAGLVLESYKAVPGAVQHLVDHLGAYRTQVRGFRNRAVFEIPEILDSILRSPSRVGVDFIQHFRAAERLHLG